MLWSAIIFIWLKFEKEPTRHFALNTPSLLLTHWEWFCNKAMGRRQNFERHKCFKNWRICLEDNRHQRPEVWRIFIRLCMKTLEDNRGIFETFEIGDSAIWSDPWSADKFDSSRKQYTQWPKSSHMWVSRKKNQTSHSNHPLINIPSLR